MDYPERLDKLITTLCKSYTNTGYTNFEDPTELKTLQKSNVFFTSSVLGMKAISHVIEDQAGNIPGDFQFYAGFQKFSRLKDQKERYLKILGTGNQVYIFGLPDEPLWRDPNLIGVPLPRPDKIITSSFANNWFVILHNPRLMSMAMASRELPNQGRPSGAADKLVYRSFEGFWTYDLAVINQLVEIFQGYINSTVGLNALKS